MSEASEVSRVGWWKRNRWRLLVGVVLTASVAVFALYAAFQSLVTPTIRDRVENEIYTIGDPVYADAVENGRGVVKLGPLPLGLYPGGLAFRTAKEAETHLNSLGKAESGWGVYVLSGDFDIDTYERDGQHYTNTSLLASTRIKLPIVEPKELTKEELKDLIHEFDQMEGMGWRVLAEVGDYAGAARSIEKFIAEHPDEELTNVHFHAGQMYAYCDDYKEAKRHFNLSFNGEDAADSPMKWNTYVKASIAFLDKDQTQLNECYEFMARGMKPDDFVPNLEIVEAFRDNVGKSYSEVYDHFRGQ